MKRMIPLLALAMMLMMTGTTDAVQDDSPLAGKWMAVSYMGQPIPEGEMWVENHADGSGTMHQGEEEFPYTWAYDADAGTCTIVADGEEMVYNVAFPTDDTCSFTSTDDPSDVMVMKKMED